MHLNRIDGTLAGAAAVVQLRDVHGTVHVTPSPAPPPPPPRQLPRHRPLVDREQPRAFLDRTWDTHHGPCWIAVEGPHGIGKTALVVDWWHRSRERWPGGALYVDLAGSTADTTLRRWCAALGHTALPSDHGRAVELWRTLTHHHRLLVVIDNADTDRAEEVWDLLPTGAGCTGAVIGTQGWARLVAHGGRLVRLPPLDPDATTQLIAGLLDEPLPAPTLAAAAAAADGSPLLAGLHAALLTHHHDTDKAHHVPDSIDHLLDLLPETTVRAATLLAAHPGPDLPEDLAAALWDSPADQAAATLGTLAVARVLTETGPGRYTLPGPVRTALLHRVTAADQAQTLDRAARFYRLRVAAADQALNTWRWRADQHGPQEAAQAQQAERRMWFPTQDAAMAWLDDELDTLVTLARILAEEDRAEPWHIAEHIATYINHRKPWTAATALYRLGLEAALASGDQVAIALMHQRCAVITTDPENQRAHLEAALDNYRAADHPEGVCSAEQTLADHLSQTGDPAGAEELYCASLAGHLALGRSRGAAITQRKRAENRARMGRTAEAVTDFVDAHRALLGLGSPDTYQATRTVQGLLRVLTLTPPETVTVRMLEMLAQQTLHQAQHDGAIHEQAGLLTNLADLARMRNDTTLAHDLEARSQRLMAPTDHPDSNSPTATEAWAP